jgi:hypothetical protein
MKTQSVLDQLAQIKLELERERQQIQQEVRNRAAWQQAPTALLPTYPTLFGMPTAMPFMTAAPTTMTIQPMQLSQPQPQQLVAYQPQVQPQQSVLMNDHMTIQPSVQPQAPHKQ